MFKGVWTLREPYDSNKIHSVLNVVVDFVLNVVVDFVSSFHFVLFLIIGIDFSFQSTASQSGSTLIELANSYRFHNRQIWE